MRPRTSCVPLLLASGALATPALAQPVSVLAFESAPGQPPRLTLAEFDPAAQQAVPLDDPFEHASWIYGLGVHASHNYTALAPLDRDALDPSDLLDPHQAVVFGLQRHERVVSLDAATFGLLADRAGLDWEPQGDADIRVRRVEAAKVLVLPAPGAVRHPSTVATAKRGERAEIRPLMDPTTLAPEPGGILPVRVYAEGDAVPGALVIATHLPTGTQHRVNADNKGIAILPLDAAGAWRLEFHTLSPAPRDDPDADWVAYSATLTFENDGGAR